MTPLDTGAVIGAGSGVGIHLAMLAKWAQPRVIAVDKLTDKLAACREVGAHVTVDASREDIAAALKDASGGGDDVGRHAGGRLITLGGNAMPFEVSAAQLLVNEIDILISKSFTASEIGVALEICARGEVWPLVTETYSQEETNSMHEPHEAEAFIGRAAIIM